MFANNVSTEKRDADVKEKFQPIRATASQKIQKKYTNARKLCSQWLDSALLKDENCCKSKIFFAFAKNKKKS